MALASFVSVTWGLAFVATKYGVESFSAPQLTALRFIIASVPALFIARPPISWPMLVAVGMTLFAGQFLLLFLAFEIGLPPGLASVTQQIHVFLTVALSALVLGERPAPRQLGGMALALGGLLLVAATVGGTLRPAALLLAVGAASSWSVGNVLMKRLRGVPLFPLIVWASLVPPLPMLLIGWLAPSGPSLPDAMVHAHWQGWAGALYLGGAATMVYGIWGGLLQRYRASVVGPFALLSPCAGIVAAAIVFGETFGVLRWCGMGLILAGVAVAVWPPRRS